MCRRVATSLPRKFFTTTITEHRKPEEVITDRAAALANVIEDLVPQALQNTVKYANNRVEWDHGRLKARLRPIRGLKTDRTATVIIEGHAFIQNLRRGQYELGIEARADHLRCAAAFDELASMI
jgi:IS6 family transposase